MLTMQCDARETEYIVWFVYRVPLFFLAANCVYIINCIVLIFVLLGQAAPRKFNAN